MTELKMPAYMTNIDQNILQNAKKNKVIFLDIDEVTPNPLNMYPLKDVDRYAENIMFTGLLNPITVIKKEKNYVIFSGHTRFAALQKIIFDECRYSYNGEDITGRVPVLIIAPFADELEERAAMMASNYTKNLTQDEKGKLIDECVEIIALQKRDGSIESGRTAHLVTTMLPFTENFIKRYLANKNRTDGSEASSPQLIAEKKKYTTICSQIERLSNNLNEFEWDNEYIDTHKMVELSEKLKQILDERLGGMDGKDM